MKKIILLAIMLIGISAFAQKLTPTAWNSSYTGVATDTIGAGTTTWNKDYELALPYQAAYVVQVKLSDRGAGGAATVALQGKNFAAESFSTITTVTWTGINSTDSIITFNSTTNKYNYNYLRVLVTRTANKATINWVKAYVKQ